MPIVQPKGLPGLKGLGERTRAKLQDMKEEAQTMYTLGHLGGISTLSDDEYKSFVDSKKDKIAAHNNDSAYINRLYLNNLFMNTFNDENLMRSMSGSERDAYLRSHIVGKAIDDRFGNDVQYDVIKNLLDEDAQYELLTNNDFKGSERRKKALEEDLKKAKEETDILDDIMNKRLSDSDKPFKAPVRPEELAGNVFTKTAVMKNPYDNYNDGLKDDNEVLEKLQTETQERRESAVNEATNAYYNSFLQADANGQASLKEIENSFDLLATKNSNYYKTFKDSKWLADYTHEEKLKDLAKFKALSDKYGEGVAMMYLDRTIQNRVADAQDGKWTGNTFKKIFVSAYTDLGSDIAFFAHARSLSDPERMAIWNMGKNPDAPKYQKDANGHTVYDKNGNPIIVDYEDNTNWLTNPAYWADAYTYNAFTQEGIKAAKEANGVSEDVNVRHYGETPDWFSWETAEEGVSQLGHLIYSIPVTYGVGGIGKGLGLAGKAAMKAAGVGAKTQRVLGTMGQLMNDAAVLTATAIPGAQLESMGQFQANMEKAEMDVKDQINQELRDYANNLDLTTPEAKRTIDYYFKELKLEQQRKIGESGQMLSTGDDALREIAKQRYEDDLMKAKYNELEQLHKKDTLEAAKAAGAAYVADLGLIFLKEVATNATIQKFRIAKGALQGEFDNAGSPLKDLVADAKTRGVKVATKHANWKGIGKGTLKQLAGGFEDEYLDGLSNSFAEGMFNTEFENYINKTYNPQIYSETVDNFVGSLLGGIESAARGTYNSENLYEGFIGAVSPVVMTGVSQNLIFDGKKALHQLIKGEDENGERLNWLERISKLLMNPLLDEYVKLKEQDRNAQRAADLINEVVDKRKGDIDKIADILSSLDDFSSPMQATRVSEEVTDEEGNKTEKLVEGAPTLLDSKDQKLWNAFTIVKALKELETMEGGEKTDLYERAMHTLQGLAEGTLSDEEMNAEVNKFLSDPDNKSILEKDNKEEIAAERLQKNSQFLLNVKQRMDEIQSTMDKSASMKGIDSRVKTMMAYNLVAEDDYKERLKTMEEELGVGGTSTNGVYTPNYGARYGTRKARENAEKAVGKMLEGIDDAIAKAEEKIASTKQKLETLQEDMAKADGEEETKQVAAELEKQISLLQSQEFQRNSLKERKELLKDERGNIAAYFNEDDAEFTVNDILSMDARDRAFILNEDNAHNYNSKQKRVIEQARKQLQKQDPSALQKIQDMGTLATRITDLDVVYDKILNNHELAASYLDAKEKMRIDQAAAISLQSSIREHYGKINKAVQAATRKKNPKPSDLKDAILNSGDTRVVDAYLEEHPEHEAVVKPYKELLEFTQQAASLISHGGASQFIKTVQLQSLLSLLNEDAVVDKKSAVALMEKQIDESKSEEYKTFLDNLLNAMQAFGIQRDTNAVETRKKKAARKEAAKRRKEKKRRKEEAAKKAAEEAAKKKQEEEERKKNGGRTPASGGTTAGSKASAASTATLSQLMNSNVAEGQVELGEGVSPDGKKGMVTVTKKRGFFGIPTFTVEVGGTAVQLNVSSKDWVVADDDSNALNEGNMKALGVSKDTPFIAVSFSKIGNDVQITGHFEGQDKTASLESSDSFDLEQFIKQQLNIKESPKKEESAASPSTSPAPKETKGATGTTSKVEEAMKPEAKEGDRNFGEVWYAPGKKGTLKGIRKKGFMGLPMITFEVEGKPVSIPIAPNEWVASDPDTGHGINEGNMKADGITKGTSFAMGGMVKIGKKWYFTGTFEGSNKSYTVEPSSDFNGTAAIQRWKDAMEEANAPEEEGTSSTEENLVVVEGEEYVQEETPVSSEDDIVNHDDIAAESSETVEDDIMDSKDTILSGAGMSNWQPGPLKNEGKLERKTGTPGDSRSGYNNWMDSMRMQPQEVTDYELAQIFAKNPKAKIRFMVVKDSDNATHDNAMKNHLLLVLDYDEKENPGITSIHKDDKRGVLTSGGRKYLVIGTAGYGHKGGLYFKQKQRQYNILFTRALRNRTHKGLAEKGMDAFFNANPAERFYVNREIHTQWVPGTLTAGYLVKQKEGESEVKNRSLTELLKEENNPRGLKASDLKVVIQKPEGLEGATSSTMKVRNQDKAMGYAFLLVPSCNGKYIPAYIKPCFWGDKLKEGTLKNRIYDLLREVTQSGQENYDARYKAFKELSNIFFFSAGGSNILLTKGKPHIALQDHNGNIIARFNLDGSFDFNAFLDAFENINPRINITTEVISDPQKMKEYDEAGALMLDISQLAAAGSSFHIYSLDSDGNMIIPEEPSSFSNEEPVIRSKYQTVYKGVYYSYDEDTGKYFVGNKAVDDADLISKLDYGRRIYKDGLGSSSTVGQWSYYVMEEGEHPVVVREHSKAKEIEILTEEQSQDYINALAEKKAKEEREKAAREELERMKQEEGLPSPAAATPVELQEEQNGETSEEEASAGSTNETIEEEEEDDEDYGSISFGEQTTFSFEDLYYDEDYSEQIKGIINRKWPEAPTDLSALKEFLKNKNVQVEGIGVFGIDAWISTLEECR